MPGRQRVFKEVCARTEAREAFQRAGQMVSDLRKWEIQERKLSFRNEVGKFFL